MFARTGGFLLYTVAVAFAFGIFLRTFVSFGLPEITWLVLLGLVVVVIARRSEAPPRFLILASIILVSTALGALRLEVASWQIVNPALEAKLGEPVVLTGVVKREPDVRERTVHLYVEVGESLVLVTTDNYSGQYAYGDLVEAKEVLQKPEAFTTDLGRSFNYPGFLLARGVTYTLPFAEVSVLEPGHGHPFFHYLYTGKQTFIDAIESLLTEPAAGLGLGLLLGEKRALGEELSKVFRETGIIHIVVLSGYNVMIVVTFVMYILGRLFGQRLSTGFGLVAIALFALLVGLSATVLRASLMAALLLIVSLTGRVYLALRGLVLAGVVMLLFNPFLLVYDTGFQLSFLATLGLIVAAGYVSARLSLVPTWLGVREFLTATLVTQVFVLPLLLYQIGEFSVVAVLVNVLVLPMVPAAMLLTFLTGIIGIFAASLAAPLSYLTYLSLNYIVVTAEWFAGLSFASFVVPSFPFYLVPVAYALLGYAVWHWLYRSQGQSDDFNDWTIVEAASLEIEAADSRRESAADHTPHFFR